MFLVLFFLLTTILLSVLLMLVPKCEKKLNGVSWTIATIIVVICIWVFGIALLDIAKIGFNLISLSMINIVVSILCSGYLFKKRESQKYYVEWKDVAVIAGLLLFTIIMGIMRFGSRIDVFAYAQDDSVRHFNNVRQMVINERISVNRYFLYLLYAVIIKVLDPIIGAVNWYRAFMMGDILMQFLLGSMFWIIICRYIKNSGTWLMGLLFLVFYYLGYPLTNMLCGFEYLGAGILTCSFIIWILETFGNNELPEWMMILLVMLGNTAVCESYTLFAPAILVGEVIYFIILFGSKDKLFSVKTYIFLWVAFIVPGFLCIYYVAKRYMNALLPYILIAMVVVGLLLLLSNISYLRKNRKLCYAIWGIGIFIALIFIYNKVLMQIVVKFMRADGSILRDPYGNFLIFLFPLILYIKRVIKGKKNDCSVWLLLATVVFSAWMLHCVYLREIGSYYFYKMHFLVWLLLCVCAFKEVAMTEEPLLNHMKTYLAIVSVGLAISLTCMEQKWVQHSDWMWPEDASETLYGVYHHNVDMLYSGGNVDRQMQTIYNVVCEIVNRENTKVLYFGEELRYLRDYFYYLTDQNPSIHRADLNHEEYYSFDIREDLEEAGILYIFVEKDYKGPYEQYKQALDVMWTEFENDYGWVLKLD